VTLHAPLGRGRLPFAAMAVGGVLALVGSFLPWVRTGSRDRNSYDVFRVVGRLGFAPDGPAATALRWWPLVPLLTIGAVVAVWWGWVRVGGAVGIAAAAYAGGVGLAVWSAPSTELVGIGAGPALTVVGAVVLLGGAVAALAVGSEPTPLVTATDRGG
jgi:hypothetical protein